MNIKRIIREEIDKGNTSKTYTNKFGEKMTLLKKDGEVYIKHDDINKDEFVPLMNKSNLFKNKYRWIFHQEEKDFIEKFINEAVNNKAVEKVVNDILSKSIIRLSEPDSHYE